MTRCRRCCGRMWRRDWGEDVADLTKLGDGVLRTTEAVLRGAGGRSVLVRVPRPGAAGDVSEQLGIAVATFDDVEIAPCVLRVLSTTGEEKLELQAGARAVAAAAGGNDVATVLAWFAAAAGVVVDGELLRIAGVSYRDVAGVPYVYRLELTGSGAAEI